MEPAWVRMRLSVQIATKLNRTHLLPGEMTYLLPCLGRIEIDEQATGPQAVSMEDSTACIHGSRGQRKRMSTHLCRSRRSSPRWPRRRWRQTPRSTGTSGSATIRKVRDAIEATYPDQFKDFNKRLFEPGGFPRPLGARERKWKTPTGKANFTVPKSLSNRVEESRTSSSS